MQILQILASEENKQMKSALTEILNTLKKSEQVPTIQQVFKLPQVIKLTQVCHLPYFLVFFKYYVNSFKIFS